jgi:hypothetical protein
VSGTDSSASRLFVTSDPHGHIDQLTAGLRGAGLLDDDGDWSGGDARLYVLGDLFDRGPDGIGVVDHVMRLQGQAAQQGGAVVTLLGNHEVLAVGMHMFGTTDIEVGGFRRNFGVSWLRNGGMGTDQDALTEKHVTWLRGLPAMAIADDHLLMHSDTLEYRAWGDTLDAINSTVAAMLAGDDPRAWWDVWSRLTTRYIYNGEDGANQARGMLERLGGSRVVHGHSIIGDLLDVASEDVDRPLLYAGDQVVAVDGGIYDGGPCLVVELPVRDSAVLRP